MTLSVPVGGHERTPSRITRPSVKQAPSAPTTVFENVGQPDFAKLSRQAIKATIYESREASACEPFEVSPPPPEPAPWTATTREWEIWTDQRDEYKSFLKQRAAARARQEEELRGTF